MAITCTLGSLDISGYLRDNPRVGGATKVWDEVGGSHADIAAQANVRTNALIEIVLPLKVTAATADLLIAAIAAIRTESKKATNTLAIKPTGATNSVTFNIVESPHLSSVPFDNVYDVGKVALFDLRLMAEPWAYGAAVTAINATNFTLPDGLSFKASSGDATTITGDVDAPLTITVVPNSDADMHNLYMGWYATADWTAYLVETDTAGSWVGGTAAAGPTTYAHGGASVKNTSADASYLPVDTAAYTDGAYLVLARVCLEDAADTATFYLATSAGTITDTVTLDPDGTHWEWIELGQVHLPVQDVSTGTANLRVYMECSDAAQYVAMDCLAFVPVDHGLVAYHPATDTTDASSLKSMLGKMYVENVVSYADASGHGIKAHGNGTLVVIAEHVDPNAATYAGTITVSYTPRFELWR